MKNLLSKWSITFNLLWVNFTFTVFSLSYIYYFLFEIIWEDNLVIYVIIDLSNLNSGYNWFRIWCLSLLINKFSSLSKIMIECAHVWSSGFISLSFHDTKISLIFFLHFFYLNNFLKPFLFIFSYSRQTPAI